MLQVKEYLSTATGTEGSLLIVKKIYDRLIEEVDKALIPRSEAALYFGPGQIPSSSIDVNLETPNAMSVRAIAEGTAIINDNQTYTSTNLKPVKYGVGIRITSEFMEDGKWNLLERNIMTAGKRFAENENSLIIAALDTAANTVAGGATVTVANITTAMQNLEASDYKPTSFAVGVEVLNDLRNTDTFAEFQGSGSTEMLDTGFKGVIYGMRTYVVSSNAGMTATTAYVFDRQHAYMIAEKRPISVERFDLPVYDLKAASITQRITVAALRTSAICNITSS